MSLSELKIVRLTTSKRVGGLQRFVECVLTPTKRVGGLQKFVGSVLSAAKCVGSLQCFGVCSDYPKSCRWLTDLWRVRFGH